MLFLLSILSLLFSPAAVVAALALDAAVVAATAAAVFGRCSLPASATTAPLADRGKVQLDSNAAPARQRAQPCGVSPARGSTIAALCGMESSGWLALCQLSQEILQPPLSPPWCQAGHLQQMPLLVLQHHC